MVNSNMAHSPSKGKIEIECKEILMRQQTFNLEQLTHILQRDQQLNDDEKVTHIHLIWTRNELKLVTKIKLVKEVINA